MADERDETQVGHQVVDPGAEQPAAEGAATTAGGDATEVFFSRDQAQELRGDAAPPTPPPPQSEPSGGGSSPAEADRIAADQQDSFAQNPLPYVGGAFVGAFVLAQILKRITGGDD